MEDESVALRPENNTTEQISDQPGAKAVEALVRAIAQEFVIVMDEFHGSLLADDETEELPRVRTAGQ